MTDTVRVPRAFSDWFYGAEGYGILDLIRKD